MRRAFYWLAVPMALAAALLAAAYYSLLPPPPLAQPAQGTSLRSVILVVPGQRRTGPVDVQVVGGVISSIRPAAEPGRVSGYVLPGLVDAHMHGPLLPMPREAQLHAFLYVYHGITHARMAAGDTAMRDAIDAGRYPGPALTSCGPFLDGDPPLWRSSLVVDDPASAQAAVRAVFDAGYDCVKVYNELTEPASRAIYEAAHGLGLPVIGHVPWRQDAAAAWMDDQQHLLGLPAPDGTRPEPFASAMLRLATLDATRINALAASLLERGVSLTPTLVTLQRKAALQHAPGPVAPEKQRLPHYYSALWDRHAGLVSSRLFNGAQFATFRAAYPVAERAVLALHEAGVTLHTGTDAPAEAIVPGAGLLEELHLLHRAGLNAEQVLALSTVVSAAALQGEAAPPLRENSPASFVLYASDPTRNLANLESRLAVVAQGRYYSAEVLEAQMQRYQTWFNSAPYRPVSNALVAAGLALINFLDR